VEKELISYTEYSHMMDELVKKISSSDCIKDIKSIYTFMRGGLPIAVHLSHFLKVEMHTDEANHRLPLIPKETLIVDDIADTGKTLDGYQDLFPIATLFYKPRSIVKPTFYVKETSNWIVFPWEKFDETPNR
jgi:hypoxanthine phosphoribosyltransferase